MKHLFRSHLKDLTAASDVSFNAKMLLFAGTRCTSVLFVDVINKLSIVHKQVISDNHHFDCQLFSPPTASEVT